MTATPEPGSDCRAEFRAAYANRYTWEPGFAGYRGSCCWEQPGSDSQPERRMAGTFQIGADFKAVVEGIDDEQVHKAIASQLWEVAIHRVRRSFEQTHAENTFTAGDTDSVGTEVLVGGKNAGDRYRIKDDVVTMVHRHIHGTVVTIFTESVTQTGQGYLSHSYTSQYSDPATGAARGGRNRFTDSFTPLGDSGPWVLRERIVETEATSDTPATRQRFRFEDLQPLA
ncbi:MAG: DUF3386 domain-containing protein [Cyanobacteriota bacterium]|nr:DUF3386 domain-containing protein [Cyanobacteriota bacterium]